MHPESRERTATNENLSNLDRSCGNVKHVAELGPTTDCMKPTLLPLREGTISKEG